MSQSFTITQAETRERLDKFLTRELNMSRNQVQQMIKDGLVRLNDLPIRVVHHFLKNGDVLNVSEPKPTKSIKAKLPKIKILHEDPDMMVIYKPAGISVHPAPGTDETTLVDWLLKNYPSVSTVGDEPAVRPGIVHRLDKDVSGCLLIAKTQEGFEHLKSQFQNSQVKKVYTALVYGRITKDTDQIDFPIDRGDSGIMVARPEGSPGRDAITIFDVVSRYPQYTLLRIQTLTGRTHQIRTHLKAYGHSIVGDKLYATRHQAVKEPLSQIFLHAEQVGFYDLSGAWLEMKASLPKELKDFLKALP